VFLKHHADLLDAAFWQSHQERIRAGYVHDVFPYERDKRFIKIHKPGSADESAPVQLPPEPMLTGLSGMTTHP
jgi:isocitrate dehydrogenase kinase/phosphatase